MLIIENYVKIQKHFSKSNKSFKKVVFLLRDDLYNFVIMEDSSSSLYEYADLPTNMTTRKDEPIEEEPPNIDIDELKTLALKEVKQQKKIKEYEKERIKSENSETQQISHNMIICTKKFMEFYNSQICDNMVISTIFYISSSLWLNTDQDIDDTQIAIQERTQAESFRILSSLYCQLILSPLSANLRVREERIFYETLIFSWTCAHALLFILKNLS
ncbi:hypothetical protein TRFO_37290 [Tritrichomonas foetus]|uniref:Uncharacterized protein n=1 Tax=Tritrichomonas foetus TaxID=1144522 RepID=A0A1J4JGG6_9EUKA|nr:hypothetical protein TRFO_37290 [Tritrichomonas foetus]|eukprot:OHS96549.1 hypothetical protein TRFO_37290 [Tritrichomonas foetus]